MNNEEAFELTQWIVAQGLSAVPETEILSGVCERLVGSGFPLLRANISQPTLHPVIGGHLFIWHRGEAGAVEEEWARNVAEAGGEFRRTPFAHMSATGKPRLRCRLGAGGSALDLPMLERFRHQGATDYFALATDFGEAHRLGPVDRILSSWLTDAQDGFDDTQLAMIEQLMTPFALAIKAASTYRIANSVIATYLGDDAGRRVLEGEIVRGSGETIRAVLWYCDLQGFTKLADTLPRDQLLSMLDDYFDTMVTTVHEFGGQVLKFMGDGLLAIFQRNSDAESCRAALDAADCAVGRIASLSTDRRLDGRPVSEFKLALHLGDVMYGNIGARNRLDFTVVGPAVNEVSRIESMCRALDRDLVISAAFAAAAESTTDRLVSLGRYALRGVRRPQELFTLDFPEDDEET